MITCDADGARPTVSVNDLAFVIMSDLAAEGFLMRTVSPDLANRGTTACRWWPSRMAVPVTDQHLDSLHLSMTTSVFSPVHLHQFCMKHLLALNAVAPEQTQLDMCMDGEQHLKAGQCWAHLCLCGS